jgi:hypothetical protein
MRRSDFHSSEDREIEERFASLRRYGRLPQGREHRGRRLTLDQIAHAILGLVTRYPAWAGHSATCLQSLAPVGGSATASFGAETLLQAISHLLSNAEAREKLIRLTITGAEAGVNSHGHAEIVFNDGESTKRYAYVHRLALSLQTPGAELTYSFDRRAAPASREISFNTEFFRRIAYEFELSMKLNRPPKGDGSEYDAEEALNAFYSELGARPRSRYLNVGVETAVQWPRKACHFPFGASSLVALPPTKEHDASLHIDLSAHRVSDREGRSLLSEALSIAVWIDDQLGTLLDGWSGNPIPLAVHRNTHRHPSSIVDGWCNSWQRVDDEQVRLLLGLYREARNLELTHSIPYALLGYYRIFENIWPHGPSRGEALGGVMTKLLAENDVEEYELKALELDNTPSGQELADLLRAERLRVAHAKASTDLNPDVSDDVSRLSVAASILRRGARMAMSDTIGITTSRWSSTWRACPSSEA